MRRAATEQRKKRAHLLGLGGEVAAILLECRSLVAALTATNTGTHWVLALADHAHDLHNSNIMNACMRIAV